MKRAIVIGASSGIGRQVASLLIQRGWNVGVAARRTTPLEELKTIAPDRVVVKQIDVTSEDAEKKLMELIEEVGGMQLFIHSAGIGWRNPELTMEKELQTMNTNATGFMRMVGAAYHYFAKNAGGHIAAITSIAGTKGLGPAPAYSATKALQTTYLEALDQLARTNKLNIHITDIRPGFVRTPFIGENHNYPMTLSPRRTARKIVRSIRKKRTVVVFDIRWQIVTFLWKLIPSWLWRRMKIK